MNPMTKVSILVIVAASLLYSVEALQCVNCLRTQSSTNCEVVEQYCEAKIDEYCLLTTVSTGENQAAYVIQSCTSHCRNSTISKEYFQLKTTCCNSRNLCNKT